jgi:ribosomal protein L24
MKIERISTAVNPIIAIGATVRRISGERYQVGNIGEIIEINRKTNRVRVDWIPESEKAVKMPRTWVSTKVIELL